MLLDVIETRPRGLTDAINETWGESLIRKIFLRSVGSGGCGFLMSILVIDYVLEVLCFKFQISRMSGTLSRTSLSIISWLDPWEDIWFLMPNLEIDYVLEV